MRFRVGSLCVLTACAISQDAIVFASSVNVAPLLIQKIEVKGNQRIGVDAITASLGVGVGSYGSEDTLDLALKNLFDLGFFKDAKIRMLGNVLVVEVEENPVINRIAFEGNKELTDDILKTEALLKPMQIYTVSKLKKDTQRIQDIYRIKGHFAAKVTPKLIKKDQNRVDVVFEIDEGEATVVSKIFFIGNKSFSHSKLETAIQTKETRWYRFFSSDDNYDPDRVAYDRELLRKFYLERGYVDFMVKSAVAELSADKKEFFITFTLSEGGRYKVGAIDMKSSIPGVDPALFKDSITFASGDWYSSKEMDRTISKITDALGSKGFAFVDVQPDVKKDEKDNIIDIVFQINDAPKLYIDRITIVGNDRTDESVIRRELRFFEGDPFNSHNQKISKQRLENLGFFKKVDIRKDPSNSPDKVNVTIEVDEERTGEISVGGGYSTSDGILGNVAFTERNFRGKGQELGIGFTLAKRRQEFDISFTEPYFLDRELSAGVDLYSVSQSKFFGDSFTQKSNGGALRIGYMLADYLSQSWAYRLSFDRTTGVRTDASRFVREQQGSSTLSSISHGIVYDRRDNRFETTEGYYLSLGNDLAGVGGNVKYLRNKIGGGYYYSIVEDVVYSLNASYARIEKIGSKLRIVDRFTLGDESLRGFQLGGISPRDKITKDALGGRQYYSLINEVVMPSPLPREFNVKLFAFADFGSAWGAPEPRAEIIDSKKLRGSAGGGFRWKSPLGPISVAIAKPLLKDKDDKTQIVHFSFATRF